MCQLGRLPILLVPLLLACASPRPPIVQGREAATQPNDGKEQEEETQCWIRLHLRNGDELSGVLLTDHLAVQTEYGTIDLPRDLLGTVKFADDQDGGDAVSMSGVTSISDHSITRSSEAFRVRGLFQPSTLRVRLVNGQELEFTREHIEMMQSVGKTGRSSTRRFTR